MSEENCDDCGDKFFKFTMDSLDLGEILMILYNLKVFVKLSLIHI